MFILFRFYYELNNIYQLPVIHLLEVARCSEKRSPNTSSSISFRDRLGISDINSRMNSFRFFSIDPHSNTNTEWLREMAKNRARIHDTQGRGTQWGRELMIPEADEYVEIINDVTPNVNEAVANQHHRGGGQQLVVESVLDAAVHWNFLAVIFFTLDVLLFTYGISRLAINVETMCVTGFERRAVFKSSLESDDASVQRLLPSSTQTIFEEDKSALLMPLNSCNHHHHHHRHGVDSGDNDLETVTNENGKTWTRLLLETLHDPALESDCCESVLDNSTTKETVNCTCPSKSLQSFLNSNHDFPRRRQRTSNQDNKTDGSPPLKTCLPKKTYWRRQCGLYWNCFRTSWTCSVAAVAAGTVVCLQFIVTLGNGLIPRQIENIGGVKTVTRIAERHVRNVNDQLNATAVMYTGQISDWYMRHMIIELSHFQGIVEMFNAGKCSVIYKVRC